MQRKRLNPVPNTNQVFFLNHFAFAGSEKCHFSDPFFLTFNFSTFITIIHLMTKTDYQKELDKILASLGTKQNTASGKPSLLLHACCGPCSSYVLEYLASIFDITIYYYNPNIHPQSEYQRRLEELKKFLTQFPQAVQNEVKLTVDSYDTEDYYKATNVRSETRLQEEPEKGERCRRCYQFRMERSWNYAIQNHFDWFTTTLTISPHKDSQMINTIGRQLEEKKAPDSKTRYLFSDFKKKSGFLRSTQLSQEYGLWRQDYCGCIFSKLNMEKLKENKDPLSNQQSE